MQEKKSLDLRLLGRVLAIARPYKGIFISCIVLALVLAPVSTIRPYIIARMVDDHITQFNLQGLQFLAMIFIGVVLLDVILRSFFIYISALLGQLVIKTMRLRVFNHITRMKLSFLDKTPIGTSTTRTINDIESINNVFTQGVVTMLADMLSVFAVIGIMFYTSWRLTLITFITLPFLIIASYIFKE